MKILCPECRHDVTHHSLRDEVCWDSCNCNKNQSDIYEAALKQRDNQLEKAEQMTQFTVQKNQEQNDLLIKRDKEIAELREKLEAAHEAITGITVSCQNGQICFRTANSVPMGMGSRKENLVKKYYSLLKSV